MNFVEEPLSQNQYFPILKAARILARCMSDPLFKGQLHDEANYLVALNGYFLQVLPFPERVRVVVASAKKSPVREQLLDFLTPEWPVQTTDAVILVCPRSCIDEKQLLDLSDFLLPLIAKPVAEVQSALKAWESSQTFDAQQAKQMEAIRNQL